MKDIKLMVGQLDGLIKTYEELAGRSKYDDLSDLKAEIRVLANRFESTIDRLALPGSTYAKQVDLQRAEPVHMKVHELYGVAVGLRDDLNDGLVNSVVELVHADTYADYLEMAEELQGKGYKDPAAVITGTSLEVHLRALCIKHGVAIDVNGAPKKADTMNADLKKASVYEGLQQKQVTSWLALRNSAAHGKYGEYDDTDVRHFISEVRAFVIKYAA